MVADQKNVEEFNGVIEKWLNIQDQHVNYAEEKCSL